MDLATAVLSFPRRRRLLLIATAGAAGYAAYRFYHHPSVTQRRRKISKLLDAFASLTDAVSSSVDAVSLVSGDLHQFLRSDSNDIPQSLKQMSKITCSEDFSSSISSISGALTSGIVRGVGSSSESTESQGGLSVRLLDKLFSDAGSRFVSVVAGSFARNLVLGFYIEGDSSKEQQLQTSSESESVPNWVKLICTDDCRRLIAESIERFVSTLVTVYVDKTMDINIYDDLFSGLTNPKHEPKVKDMLVSICNGATETLVKTSHQVLSRSNNSDLPSGKISDSEQRRRLFESNYRNDGNWMNQVSTTLAEPKNRKFVLDVSGKITFEMVRSFLDFVMWKLYDGAKTGVDVVQEQTVKRGLEVMRYVNAKSMMIVTICLALCLHILTGTRVLTPA